MISYTLKHKVDFDDNYQKTSLDTFDKIVKEAEDGISGYYNLPYESQALVTQLKKYAKELNHIDTIAVIGIGGSSLGTKAIHEALRQKVKDVKRLIFFENPDPLDISEKFLSIKKETTLFLIISKSGSTIEPISIFKAIIEKFDLNLDIYNKNIIAITDHNSALYKFADELGIKTFVLKKSVGGRFSVLSSVGIVPLTLAGYDTMALLLGAKAMLESFFEKKEEHIFKKAFSIVKNQQSCSINILFSYSNVLKEFTQWYVQLWAESLGKIDKDANHVGLTPIGHIGSIDQHSFLQLIIEGPRDKMITFIKIDNFENSLKVPNLSLKYIQKCDYINGHTFNELINAECDATTQSVSEQGINIDIITLDKLNEKNIGELIIYYELLTSVVGSMLGINTYNQEGVELGKRILVNKFKK